MELMQSNLTLRWPREDEEEEFMRAHRATSPDVPSFLHYYTEGMPFRRYLEVLAEQDQGINLPSAHHVPVTFLFAFVGSRIVGRTSIRHSLNESLERVGGHIGYVVVPEFRRQGYATAILHLSLQIAREKCRWRPSRSRDLRRRQCRVNPDYRKKRGHPRERRQWTGPRQAETPLLD